MAEVGRFVTRKDMLKVTKDVSERMVKVKEILMDQYGVFFSNKNLSEIIGQVFGKVSATYFTSKLGYEVKNALTDKEPDLFFTEIKFPVEIKVTSTEKTWQGGEFSRRPFHYFLVSWGGRAFDEYFVCFVKLTKKDWKSNMQNRRYGPTLKFANVLKRKNKIVLVGKLTADGKVERERV